jgi:glycosyltransferase involved in cell wall biosynthesis
MDYWANVDAVVWFCEHAWPIILKALPQLQFFIVGGGPHEKVIQLGHLEGVTVTGRVADVRPFLKHAECVVAPLRIARGVQNKVLEAMAMSKAVVMTTMAEEGIVLPSEQKPLVTDSESEFASLVIKMVKDPEMKAPLETSNRDYIVERFSWVGALSIIDTLFKEPNI